MRLVMLFASTLMLLDTTIAVIDSKEWRKVRTSNSQKWANQMKKQTDKGLKHQKSFKSLSKEEHERKLNNTPNKNRHLYGEAPSNPTNDNNKPPSNLNGAQKIQKIYEIYKDRIDTWSRRLKRGQDLKDDYDKKKNHEKALQTRFNNRDFLVQTIFNMEKEIYAEEANIASQYETAFNKTIELRSTKDIDFYEKNEGKRPSLLNWEDDIFQ